MKFLILSVVALFFQIGCKTTNSHSSLMSGVRDGNGGHGVVCEDAQPNLDNKKIGFYDLYEVRRMGFNPSFSDDQFTIEQQNVLNRLSRDAQHANLVSKINLQKARYFLEKVKTRDPQNFAAFSKYLGLFAQSHAAGECPNYADEGAAFIPAGCHMEVAVCKNTPHRRNSYHFIINQDLWKSMNDADHIAAMIHESVYRRAVELSHDSSVHAVTYVVYLLSGEIERMSRKEYAKFLKEEKFPAYLYWQGGMGKLFFDMETVELFPDGRIKQGVPQVFVDPTVSEGGATYANYSVGRNTFSISFGSTAVTFNEEGQIETLSNLGTSFGGYEPNAPEPFTLGESCFVSSPDEENARRWVSSATFHHDVLSGVLPYSNWLIPKCALNERQPSLPIQANNWVKLYSNGTVQQATLSRDVMLFIDQDQSQLFKANQTVSFSEQGFVLVN